MIRYLAILTLIASGLPGLGVGLARGCDDCGDSACHQPVVQTACCGGDSGEDGFCPVSNGPCECVAAPAPDPEPKPQAPLPRSDRDTVTGTPDGPALVTHAARPGSATPRLAPLVLTLNASRSHNEIQSLLGIWRR